uniref:RING-type domain-containing protein n=1 Tax=Lygus hesperus TaxID=30085 RepID=A0A0K8TF37_LYGHE
MPPMTRAMRKRQGQQNAAERNSVGAPIIDLASQDSPQTEVNQSNPKKSRKTRKRSHQDGSQENSDGSMGNWKNIVAEIIGQELSCCICLDLLSGPVTLNCGHTLCASCLGELKKKQNTCPSCRAFIRTEVPTPIIDSIIDSISPHLGEDFTRKRQESKTNKWAGLVSSSTSVAPPAQEFSQRLMVAIGAISAHGRIYIQNASYEGPIRGVQPSESESSGRR